MCVQPYSGARTLCRTRKREEEERHLNSFASCVHQYIELYAKRRQKSWKDTERVFRKYALPVWGERPIKEIRRKDVVQLLDKVVEVAPHQANRLRICLSRIYKWLIEREVVETSPILGVAPRIKARARSRMDEDDEPITSCIVACDEEGRARPLAGWLAKAVKVLRDLRDSIAYESGGNLIAHLTDIPLSSYHDLWYSERPNDKKDTVRKNARRQLEDLHRKGLIEWKGKEHPIRLLPAFNGVTIELES